MGKPNGFIEFKRVTDGETAPAKRVQNFSEFHIARSKKESFRQGARCMDCGVPFCQTGFVYRGKLLGCPLHNLIPEWNDTLMQGNHAHALARLLKNNDFPEFTGRVCPAPCEDACTCNICTEPITVKNNELDIIEAAFAENLVKPVIPSVRTGKTVAVVGSGPAGLAAAKRLNMRGHSVTVFERDDRIGGLLMYGIPNMKLPKEIVDRRVALMREEGIEFVTNTELGKDIQLADLKREFDCVILCCGAGEARTDKIISPETPGVHFAMEYLRAVTKSLLDGAPCSINAKDKDVIVIGAGDTASDCIATAIRQGCRSIKQLIRRPRESYGEMRPDYALEEASAVFGCEPRLFGIAVTELIKDGSGNLSGVKTTGGDFQAQLLLLATGFSGAENKVCQAAGIKKDKNGNPVTADNGYCLDGENVFIAGDMRCGASLVVLAIKEGRCAAKEADRFLMDYTSL